MKKILLLLLCYSFLNANAQAPLIFTGYDLNTLAKGFSNPYGFVDFNGKFVFMAYTDTAGYEPWVSDGTTTGTFMLKNIGPNATYSNFSNPTILGGKLYFHYTNRNYNDELWVTDGTSAGTQLVTTISQLSSNYQQYMTAYNGKLYFTANDYTNETELWVSDGTAAGTQMLKDINPTYTLLRPNGSNPVEFTEFNGKLFFGANDSLHGKELWITDGTTAGTLLFKDIEPGAGAGDPTDFYVSGSYMYFKAYTSATGKELWRTDGTVAGTVMVKDIYAGTGNGVSGYGGTYFHYHNWVTYNGKVFFQANDSTHGAELWMTDGTTAGTTMVKDINSYGSSSGAPYYFTVYNNMLYFDAADTAQNWELWRTDGTTSGTVSFKDIAPGTQAGSSPVHLISYKNHLYFSATASTAGSRLWRTDGTLAGTSTFAPATTTNTGNQVAGVGGTWERFYIYPRDSALYFAGNFTSTANELWSLNDTTGYKCDSPTHLTISSIGGTYATASWDTVAGVTQYEYYVGRHPSTPGIPSAVTYNHSINLVSLSPNTTYDFCVRSKCTYSPSVWICDTFRTSPTGINILNTDNDVHIYPNPSKGSFTISLNNNHAAITVFDITGRIVTSKQMENASETISLNNAAKGIYTIRIRTDGAVINKRVVIE